MLKNHPLISVLLKKNQYTGKTFSDCSPVNICGQTYATYKIEVANHTFINNFS